MTDDNDEMQQGGESPGHDGGIDFARLINAGRESRDLDYKAPIKWDEDDKRACCELVKDVLALANSGGGWLVIGVSEQDKDTFVKEGLTPEQSKSFEATRLSKFVNNYADPPVDPHVYKPEVDGKRFVCIQVPGFPDTPHICQKDFPKTLSSPALYVRNDAKESASVKNSADFRRIVERAIRQRGDQLLTSFRAILKEGIQPPAVPDEERFRKQIDEAHERWRELTKDSIGEKGYRAAAIFPARFDAERFDLQTLREMAENGNTDFRGWPFLFYSNMRSDLGHTIQDGHEMFEPQFEHFWRLHQSGLFFGCQVLYEDQRKEYRSENKFLDFDGFSMMTGEMLNCLKELYTGRIEDDEAIVLRFELHGMGGRRLGSTNPHRNMRRGAEWTSHIDPMLYPRTRSLAEWRAGLVDHALDICSYVFQRFNWAQPDLAECRKLIESMLQRPRPY
ncbi:MAG: ATP-binding protein [Candidatus Hydrogenedentes bacterium]|nr:ATP-binding protein [Candidatus Hydrogenedentota bacterium]